MTKRCANPTDYNKEMLFHQVSECANLIVEVKDTNRCKHLAKLSSELDNPDTVPKTY